MENDQLLNQSLKSGFYLIDNNVIKNILYPFALDEWLSKKVAIEQIPIVHFWTHPRAFVLGLRDKRLPNVDEAISFLKNSNYDVMVRNSGGAAVPLDSGILNISIILPLNKKESIKVGYEIMYQFIKKALYPLDVKKGEIVGSYCPGEYDLGIDNKKICGISQRRWKDAYVIQAFVIVEGTGMERAFLAKKFYQIASNRSSETLDFIVKNKKMISLFEAASLSIQSVKNLFIEELEYIGKKKLFTLKAEYEDEIQLLMKNLKTKYF